MLSPLPSFILLSYHLYLELINFFTFVISERSTKWTDFDDSCVIWNLVLSGWPHFNLIQFWSRFIFVKVLIIYTHNLSKISTWLRNYGKHFITLWSQQLVSLQKVVYNFSISHYIHKSILYFTQTLCIANPTCLEILPMPFV